MDDTIADSENAWEDDWDEEPIQLAKSQAQQLLETNDQEEKCLPIHDESNQEDSNEAPMQEICPNVECSNQVSEFTNDLSNMLTALENEQNDKDLIINTNIELENNAWEDDWDEEPIQLNLQKDPLPESSIPSETSSQLKDDLTDQTSAAPKNTHKEVLQVEQISVTDDDTSCIFSHAELSSPPDNAVPLENCNAPSQTPEATENVSHALADSKATKRRKSTKANTDTWKSILTLFDVCIENNKIKVPIERNYSHLNFARPLPANIAADPSPFPLPPLPAPIEEMTQDQLKAFIPRMLKYSTGRGTPGWGKDSTRPPWWPADIPWANVRCDARNEEDKQKGTLTKALRQIVIKCYKFHGREDLLNSTQGIIINSSASNLIKTHNGQTIGAPLANQNVAPQAVGSDQDISQQQQTPNSSPPTTYAIEPSDDDEKPPYSYP